VSRECPDGVAAVARPRRRTLSDLSIERDTRVVIADAFELAGNLGTLIRCADGAGASAVIVTERAVRIHHPLVLKASMGTVLSMPVIDADRASVLSSLRASDVRIVAADPSAPVSYRDSDWSGPVAIVLGSERYGLSPFWRAAADVVVSIPMLGVADSLNVGHAAALLLYEALAAVNESDA
jgi:TrmH family RNA methyltransferase